MGISPRDHQAAQVSWGILFAFGGQTVVDANLLSSFWKERWIAWSGSFVCCLADKDTIKRRHLRWESARVTKLNHVIPADISGEGNSVGWIDVLVHLFLTEARYRQLAVGAADGTGLRHDVGVELRGLPAVRGADLVGRQAQGPPQVRPGDVCSGNVRAAKNRSIKKTAS
jgi:hypothetical protein